MIFSFFFLPKLHQGRGFPPVNLFCFFLSCPDSSAVYFSQTISLNNLGFHCPLSHSIIRSIQLILYSRCWLSVLLSWSYTCFDTHSCPALMTSSLLCSFSAPVQVHWVFPFWSFFQLNAPSFCSPFHVSSHLYPINVHLWHLIKELSAYYFLDIYFEK